MKTQLLIITFFFFIISAFAQTVKKPIAPATNGRNITVTLTPLKNCLVYLGTYYGKGRVLSDSALLDVNGHGAFKNKTKLPAGIYFLVSPQMVIQFEFLIGNQQQFSIVADTTKKESPAITGSPDNDLFKEYSKISVDKGKNIANLSQQLATAKTKADSTTIKNEIIKFNKDLQLYREDIIKKHPSSLLATLLAAMKRPEVPSIPIVNGKADSLYPYRFVKDHFWDDVAFNDDRLLHTPFFEPKLDDYFKYYVSPESDSIIAEVKYMLLSARTGKEMYPYLLTKFTNKYLNPEYMGQDKVFLYLFENFYTKGDTTFLNASSRKMIFDRAYSMMANQIGNPAPLLELTDTTGKISPMHNLKGPFTLVVFWDPTCGHCKEELPRVDSIYKAKWKSLGVQLYSVNIAEKTMDELKKFVNDKHFSPDWVYTYEPKTARDAQQAAGQPNFRQLYDVFKTPTLYLLDEKKNIIAKQLSIEQFDDLIAAKLKKK
jgi:thiol-disulfide isomerase/thioredoxin